MLLLVATLVLAQPHAPVGAGKEAALALVGKRYDWGGRLRGREGLDCMAVVLAAAERASGCGWRSYPVKPTELIAKRLWGAPVDGLAPVSSEAVRLEQLQAGDVLFFIGPAENAAEPAVGLLGGTPMWVWHVGLYLGEGRFVVGDHHAGAAIVEALVPYLSRYAGEFSGLFVTRGPAERPRPCRRHPPLGR